MINENEINELFEDIETDIEVLKNYDYYANYLSKVANHIMCNGYDYQKAVNQRISWMLARFTSNRFKTQKEILAIYVNEFRTNKELKELKLSFILDDIPTGQDITIPLNEISIQVLGKLLSVNNSITSLTILGNEWNENSISLLCNYLNDNHTINTLNYSSSFTTKAFEIFASFLNKNKNIKKIKFFNMEADFETFFDHLKGNYTLETIEIINCSLGLDRSKNFWNKNTSISTISSLMSLIKTNNKLKRLNLMGNFLGESHLKILIQCLKWNKTIQKLEIESYMGEKRKAKDKVIKMLSTDTSLNPKEYCKEFQESYSLLEIVDALMARNKKLDEINSSREQRATFVVGLYENHLKSFKPLKSTKSLGSIPPSKSDGTKPLLSFRSNERFDQHAVDLIFYFADCSQDPQKMLNVIQASNNNSEKSITEKTLLISKDNSKDPKDLVKNLESSNAKPEASSKNLPKKNSEEEFKEFLAQQESALAEFSNILSSSNNSNDIEEQNEDNEEVRFHSQ